MIQEFFASRVNDVSTGTKKLDWQTKNPRRSEGLLWYYRDSNLGHTDFQSVALPTELWYRIFRTANIRKFLLSRVRRGEGPRKFFPRGVTALGFNALQDRRLYNYVIV